MTATRTWRFPDLRNGATFHHITDTHFGGQNHAQFVEDWLDNIRQDMEWLSVYVNTGHVHTGDMIHWFDGQGNSQASADTETQWYKAWRALIQRDGLPWAEAVGNHDLLGPGPDMQRTPRKVEDWASSIDIASQNMVSDFGDFKVITVGPDTWQENTDFVLSADTLTFLDTELQAARKPCWVAAHVPFNEQMGTSSGGFSAVEPANAGIVDVIDSNPNAIGWLSGHRHIDIRDTPNHATAFTVGSRKIFGVNGPSCGGGRHGETVSFQEDQWKAWNYSMFITYMGDAIDVRWRDHNMRTWTNPPGEAHRLITLT